MLESAQSLFAAGLQRVFHHDLELISEETSQGLNPDTGAPYTMRVTRTHWAGRGSVQASLKAQPAVVTNDQGGTEEVLVAYRAYLPADAEPARGQRLRVGSVVFDQVTPPIQPGGGDYWQLNLGAPHELQD